MSWQPLWSSKLTQKAPERNSGPESETGRLNESRARRIAKIAALTLLLFPVILACAGAGAFAALYVYFAQDLPASAHLDVQQLSQSVKIFDRNGGLLYEVTAPEGGRRTLVTPEQIPQVMKQAIIATEDPSFYSNPGVDPFGVLRAIYYQVRYNRLIGGSTITQQLVKNLYLDTEVSIERKVREAFLALELTRRYSKEEILAAYLNTIYFGNQAYGIQAASDAYFKKTAAQLDLSEASLLAGLPQAPSLYDPCENPAAALGRQKIVLDLMGKAGYLSDDQAATAAAGTASRVRTPDFKKQCRAGVAFKSPHFSTFVREQLEQQYGPEVLYRGGFQVTTTLDPQLQAIAEEEARKQVAALKDKNVSNAAVVILNPHTGEILAMVGSVDFANEEIDGQVNMAIAPRQPGSSIKPINYVTAFKNGWTPATPIYDLKTSFPNGNGKPPYVPVNYDGKAHGLVSVRTALASSLNVPAVKALYSTSTPDENKFPHPLAMLQTARDLGITTLTDENGKPRQTYGLALTLGGGEVKLLELAGAYATLANGGGRAPLTPFLKIEDAKKRVLFDLNGKDKPKPQCAQFEPNARDEQPDANGACVKSAPFAYLITNILSDNDARTLGFGANSVLKLSRPAAAKTGTTNDFRDNWTIGYTPDLVTGVWVGNANNAAMKNVTGVTGAAPIWHNIMERVTGNTPAREFPVPPGLVKAEICTDSGLLATDLCPAKHRRQELFVAGHAPTSPDTVWRRSECSPGQFSAVFVVPLHDVGDLIPYGTIQQWWAANGGARVLGEESNPCSAPAVQKQNPGGSQAQIKQGNAKKKVGNQKKNPEKPKKKKKKH